jgi:VanZ family protein
MEFSDVFAVPAPTRFSIAGGFAMAVAFASFLHAPDAIAETGPLGLYALDKWIHAGSYAVVAFLLAYAAHVKHVLLLVAIAVVTTLAGVGIEFVQSTIPWRTFEVADMYANTVGAVAAVALWRVVWSYYPFPAAEDAEE